jgi:hypothetical protein
MDQSTPRPLPPNQAAQLGEAAQGAAECGECAVASAWSIESRPCCAVEVMNESALDLAIGF